jgi:hypothetical protein
MMDEAVVDVTKVFADSSKSLTDALRRRLIEGVTG